VTKTEAASVFAWEGWPIDIAQVRTINHMQSLGAALVRAGRLLSFPATTQYRLEPAALADPPWPGRVRFVTVSLADPHYRLVSTFRVPPQDFGWWRRDAFPDAYLAARGLPPEVRDLIAEYAFVPDGPLLDRAEVAAFRADTAWERVRVAAEVNRLLWSHFVQAEDSGIREGCTWSDNCVYLSKSFGEMDRDDESDNRGSSGDRSAAQHLLNPT